MKKEEEEEEEEDVFNSKALEGVFSPLAHSF